MKHFFFITGLWVVWLLIQIFSHDYVAASINHDNQQKHQQIKQGSYQYFIEPMTINQVVKSFQDGWVNTESGIVSVRQNPEVSLELKDFLIVPRLHQSIVVDANVVSTSNKTMVRLELSNQKKQIYYHSEAISPQLLAQPLDLSSLQWEVIDKQANTRVSNQQVWRMLESFDALVIRFYDSEKVELKQLLIAQHEPKIIDDHLYLTCEYDVLECFNNNHKKNIESKWNYAKGASLYKYEQISFYNPLFWLVLAATLMCLVLFAIHASSFKVMLLVLFIFVSIGNLHLPIITDYAEWLGWVLLPIIVLLLWFYKEAFLKPQKMAISIYVISLGVAFLLIITTQTTADFVTSLPGYFIWALIQQLMLGPVVSDFLKENSTGSDWQIAWVVGVLFSVVHAPNHTLMLATLLAGLVWSFCWLKYRNLYANAFSHALLALTFYQVMPVAWLGSARIGVFF